MERKIGEIFTYKGKTYQTVLAYNGCKSCAFDKGIICLLRPLDELTANCKNRKGNTDVIFKEIKDMDIKNNQLTIDIPKGMEIDTKNSDLTKGIIRFKHKSITYTDVEEALNLEGNRTAVAADVNNVSKLSALDKLMNIAKYYNGEWKPNWKHGDIKYYIYFDNNYNKYDVNFNDAYCRSTVYFKNSEDARAVIDNPNFRDILDTIYKN